MKKGGGDPSSRRKPGSRPAAHGHSDCGSIPHRHSSESWKPLAVAFHRSTSVCASLAEAQMGSSFRWNDEGVVFPGGHVQALSAWIPAFAGMTVERDSRCNALR